MSDVKQWVEQDLRHFVQQLTDDLERWRKAAQDGAEQDAGYPSHDAYKRVCAALEAAKVESIAAMTASYPEGDEPPPPIGSS